MPGLVAYAKSNKAKTQYGSVGGSATYIACLLLNPNLATTVPYRGYV